MFPQLHLQSMVAPSSAARFWIDSHEISVESHASHLNSADSSVQSWSARSSCCKNSLYSCMSGFVHSLIGGLNCRRVRSIAPDENALILSGNLNEGWFKDTSSWSRTWRYISSSLLCSAIRASSFFTVCCPTRLPSLDAKRHCKPAAVIALWSLVTFCIW
jgi:hypothetical protein